MMNKKSVDHIVGTCTCKIEEVVDKNSLVIGLDSVQIVDGSIMPSLPSGNTHATCVMIGEYAAKLVLDSDG